MPGAVLPLCLHQKPNRLSPGLILDRQTASLKCKECCVEGRRSSWRVSDMELFRLAKRKRLPLAESSVHTQNSKARDAETTGDDELSRVHPFQFLKHNGVHTGFEARFEDKPFAAEDVFAF